MCNLFYILLWDFGVANTLLPMWMYLLKVHCPGSMHDTGCSGLVHWDDPEGWDGEGGGRGSGWGTHVNPWLIHVNVWQNHYNIVK